MPNRAPTWDGQLHLEDASFLLALPQHTRNPLRPHSRPILVPILP